MDRAEQRCRNGTPVPVTLPERAEALSNTNRPIADRRTSNKDKAERGCHDRKGTPEHGRTRISKTATRQPDRRADGMHRIHGHSRCPTPSQRSALALRTGIHGTEDRIADDTQQPIIVS